MLWCIVCGIFSCGKHIHKAFVCPSVCPSLCEHIPSPITMVCCQIIRNTYCLWRPNCQGHMSIFKVTQAKKNLVKRVNFRVFGHFLENPGGKGMTFGMLMYLEHLFRFPSRFVDFTNICGVFFTQWSSSNLEVPDIFLRTHRTNGLKFAC